MSMNKKIAISSVVLMFLLIIPLIPINVTASSSQAMVRTEPQEITVMAGEEFTIAVVIENVSLLYGLDIIFSWDVSYVEYVSHSLTIPVETYPDPIPPSPYPGILHEPGLLVGDTVDETAGTYTVAYASLEPAPVFNGNGTVFTMTFKARYIPGDTTLHFAYIKLVDNDAISIPYAFEDGFVEIWSPGTMVRTEPQEITVEVGEEFVIAVVIEYASSLYGLDVYKFSWDTTYLEYIDHTRTLPVEHYPDPIPPSPYPGILHNQLFMIDEGVDETAGVYSIAAASLAPAQGFSGSGTVFTMTFKAKQQTTSTILHFTAVDLAGYCGLPLPCDTKDGSVHAISWEYVFEDEKRNTMLKISTDDQYFQFIAPDKTFSFKHDPEMSILNDLITILYEDDEIKLAANAQTRRGFCFARAEDMQTGQKYLLIDKPTRPGGPALPGFIR
jgi:hypothetical protein